MKVFIKTTFEALHRWKDAPKQQSYLRNVHRHIFHVRLEIDVTHVERDIEFIQLKNEVNELISEIKNDSNSVEYSCETYGALISHGIWAQYKRAVTCEVSEDDENGAIISINQEGKVL